MYIYQYDKKKRIGKKRSYLKRRTTNEKKNQKKKWLSKINRRYLNKIFVRREIW